MRAARESAVLDPSAYPANGAAVSRVVDNACAVGTVEAAFLAGAIQPPNTIATRPPA